MTRERITAAVAVLALVGLKDDYRHEGRVLAEVLDRRALPGGFGDPGTYARLGQLLNQINSPVGQFGQASLRASTVALESGTAQNDSAYTTTNQRLAQLGTQRDQLAHDLTDVLDSPVSTAVGDRDHSASSLQDRALALLQQAWLASGQ